MLVSERQAEHAVANKSGATNRNALCPTTSPADLTPTAAWSRRVPWIGGLIQAAFAAFWLVRGSAVIGGGVAGMLIAVFGVSVIGGVCLCDQRLGWHGSPAGGSGGQADRALGHRRHGRPTSVA